MSTTFRIGAGIAGGGILGDGSKRYQQIVTTLLAAGADPRIGDRGGVTALQHATRRGHGEVARILRNA